MKICVYDFDETLFPSNFINSISLEPTSSNYLESAYSSIEKSIKQLLTLAKKYYDAVIIITNAEERWVLNCADKMPNSGLYDVEIISTRDRKHNEKNGTPILYPFWKTNSFLQEVKPFFDCEGGECYGELISFGDMEFDRDAALTIKHLCPKIKVKNILLERSENLEQFLTLHKTLFSQLLNIFEIDEHLDLIIKCI